jgi:5-methylcytosine-specific restriction protein A
MLRKPCLEPGCRSLADPGKVRCAAHRAAKNRAAGSATARGYDAAWRLVRRRVLDRDGHRCQIRLPGCEGSANTVDHITPLAHGGARLDEGNLRASCTRCNSRLGGSTRRKEPA